MELKLQKSGDRLTLTLPQQIARDWNLDEHSILELIQTDDGPILRKKRSASRLDALLASIPPDFTYPDDIADFVESDPTGREQL